MGSKAAYKVHKVFTLQAFVAILSRLLSLYLKNMLPWRIVGERLKKYYKLDDH